MHALTLFFVSISSCADIIAALQMQGSGQFLWGTYEESYKRAAGVVRCMLAMGIPRGAFVGLCAHNSAAHVEVLLACMLGGFVAVPLSLHLTDDYAAHIVQVSLMSLRECDGLQMQSCIAK